MKHSSTACFDRNNLNTVYLNTTLCEKVTSVDVWSLSGPYSVQMRKNTDEKDSEYVHFSRSLT